MLMAMLIATGCGNFTRKNATKAVDSEIIIQMWETPENGAQALVFGAMTTEQFPCDNLSILTEMVKTDDRIDIDFRRVYADEPECSETGPAFAFIEFGAISSGTYQLNIRNGGVRYSGTFTVTPEKYTIDFPDNAAFSFRRVSLNKIPQHTIWGAISLHHYEGDAEQFVQSFFSDLADMGATEITLTPGEYTHFEIDEEGNLYRINLDFGQASQYFVLRYAGVKDDLEAFLRQVLAKHGHTVMVTMFTDRGDRLFSWHILP